MADFISNQPHPETNESACTWLLPDAAPLKPLWNERTAAAAGIFWQGKTFLAAAFTRSPVETVIYLMNQGGRLSEAARFREPYPVRHVCLFTLNGRLMAAILSDAFRVYDTASGACKGSILTDHAQSSFCEAEGSLYLIEGTLLTKLDGNLCRTAETLTIRAGNTSDYPYSPRKDAIELRGRTEPGTRGGHVFCAFGRVFYACGDIFDRCGTENEDTFICQAERLDARFSRRYLAIPSAACKSVFTAEDGTVTAVVIGTESSVCPGLAALVRLEWSDGGYLRPDRHLITENAVTARMQPLPFTDQIRDSFVYSAPDGWYYLTGTTKRKDGTFWTWTNGIHIWRTKDFSSFEDLGTVYDYTADPDCWQMQASRGTNTWAPEITYHAGTFWLTYSTAPGCGLLKSVSGKAEGPYADMGRVVMKGIDSGFYAEDGKLYLIWQNGMIAPFNESCTTFTQEPRLLLPSDGQQVGYEGAGLIRVNGKYVLYAAEWNGDLRIDGTYDMMYSVSDSMYGPYSPRRVLVPHGGHGSLFYAKDGALCFSMFGNDRTAAFRHGFGIGRIRVKEDQDGLSLEPYEWD